MIPSSLGNQLVMVRLSSLVSFSHLADLASLLGLPLPIFAQEVAVGCGKYRMKDAPLILVVDDEPSYRNALSIALIREGLRVETAADGHDAIQKFNAAAPALVLLDVMLPKMSGLDVCRAIRSRSRVPIIMVSARSSEVDSVVGLEMGADDYVTKPFRLPELVARVRAALRRAAPESAGQSHDVRDVIEIAGLRLDSASHQVTVRGCLVSLPLKEFDLLETLMENAGRVVTREVLIERGWGKSYCGDTKTLDVHMKRLRSRIEIEPANPRYIVTVRGVGYRFDRPATAAVGHTREPWVTRPLVPRAAGRMQAQDHGKE